MCQLKKNCFLRKSCSFFWRHRILLMRPTRQKVKFSIKNFFSECDQIRSFLRIWSHLLTKSLMENFSFCAVTILLIRINQIVYPRGNLRVGKRFDTLESNPKIYMVKFLSYSRWFLTVHLMENISSSRGRNSPGGQ